MWGTLPTCEVIMSQICLAGTPTREFTTAMAEAATALGMLPPTIEDTESVVFPLWWWSVFGLELLVWPITLTGKDHMERYPAA